MDTTGKSCCFCHTTCSNLKRCTRCLDVQYCSKACQTMDWPGHRTICGRQSGLRRNADSPRDGPVNGPQGTDMYKAHIRPKSSNFIDDGNNGFKLEGNNSGNQNNSIKTNKETEAKMKSEYSRVRKSINVGQAQGGAEERQTELVNDTHFSQAEKKNSPSCMEPKSMSDIKSHADEDSTESTATMCKCCDLPGAKKCSRCKNVFYCSKECQIKDWPAHKDSCKKKLTAEEEKIKETLERRVTATNKHRRFIDDSGFRTVTTVTNFQGPSERLHQTLTLKQALIRATRPEGSLERAVRFARLFFPLLDIVTDFSNIPWEPTFPFFPFMFPQRTGYVLVAFMYRYHEHVMRHGVYLKDAKENESKVEFYLDHVNDNPLPFFSYSQVKPGGYICLIDPVVHLFGDGTVGIRINNPEQVKVLDIK